MNSRKKRSEKLKLNLVKTYNKHVIEGKGSLEAARLAAEKHCCTVQWVYKSLKST